MTTPTAAREPASGFSAWIAMALFFAVAIGGLFYVKWSPYYAKAFIAAQDHTLGASILSGNAAAPPGVSWQAGLAYSFAPQASNPAKGSGPTPQEIEKARVAQQAEFIRQLSERWRNNLFHL